MFNLENTLKKHLGITFDMAGTSPDANGITLFTPLTTRQKQVVTEGVDKVYTTFTGHVAEGRNMSIEDVLNVAEGRVWSGSNALELGLVDGIGGLSDALAFAIDLADISDDYMIYELTPPPTTFEELLDSINSMFVKSTGVNNISFDDTIRKFIEQNIYIFNSHGIQCIMPNRVDINI